MVPLCLHAEESMPEFTPDLPLVLDLVSRSTSATYDGNLWLRPASMACPPVSADQQVPRAFPAVAIFLTEFVGR